MTTKRFEKTFIVGRHIVGANLTFDWDKPAGLKVLHTVRLRLIWTKTGKCK